MPNVVFEVFFWVVKTYATAVARGGFSAFLAKLTLQVLLTLGASKLFGPKIPGGAGLSGHAVTKRSALEYRKVVYGQANISGPIVYTNLSGDNAEYLWTVIALSQGLSEDLVEVWFDGDVIPKADIDWTAGTLTSDGTGTGDVSTAKWVGDNSTKGAQIFYYLGDDAQPACGVLDTAFAEIDTSHRLRGVTYIVTKLLYNVDTENVWKAGQPGDTKAVIKGRKVYDPRLDTTRAIDDTTSPYGYGSGAHRITDATTWAWSDNPALCIADYLYSVMGVGVDYIDWVSIANGADDCEVQVVTLPAASPENTENRFTCNGVISLGASHKDNLDVLLSSCDGKLSYTAGVWKFRASVWEASSVSFDEDDLAGDVKVRGSSPKSDRFNTVRGFFVDPDRKYESVEFPHVVNSTYVTRDNGETISADLQLPMTNSETMAQRIAIRRLNQSNNQIICELELNARGAKVAIGDVVSLTISELSWSSKTFRCIEWSRGATGKFNVTLQEDSSASYTDPVVGDYTATSVSSITVPADVMPPPTGLTATGGVGGIRLDWTAPPSATYDYIDIYEDTNDSWAGATLIASVRGSSFFVSRSTGTTYYYWVRARRAPNLESLRSPDSDTTTISAAASGGSDGSSVFNATIYKRNSGAPTKPSDDTGSFNFTTQTLTAPAGWSTAIPSPGSPTLPVYACNGIFSVVGTTGTDSTVVWSAVGLVAQDGTDGAAGAAGSDGAAAVYINQYIRSVAQPSTPGTTSASYNFDTTPGTFTPTSGWTAGVPAAGSPTLAVWASTAQFYTADGTGTDGNTTWTAPQKLAEDGTPGATGATGTTGSAGSAAVYVNQYIRQAAAPSLPGAGSASYNFDTQTFTPTSGWTAGVPAVGSPSHPIWVSTAQFYSADSTGTDSSTTWSAVQKLAEDGAAGATGATGTTGSAGSAAVYVNQYIRQAATPSLPGASSASYNFDTATFTPTATWTAGVPAAGSPTHPVWVSTAQFYSADSTGTDSSTTWSAVQKLAEDGIDGSDGATGGTGAAGSAAVFVNQYIRSAAAPSLPGASSASFNFDTTTFTPTATWTAGVPAVGSPSLPVWVSTAQFYSADSTGTDSSTTWSAVQKLAEDGIDGVVGATGAAGSAAIFVNQYIRQSGTPSLPGASSASYNFDTATFTPTATWSVGVPAVGSPSYPVWVSTAQFYSADSTGTDSSTTWSAVQKLAEDGIDGVAGSDGSAGADGAAAVYVNQFIRSAAQPSTPGAASASYNFDTTPGTFTPTATWAAGVPAAGSPTLAVWASTAQFYTADGTGTDSSTTWTTPQKLAEDGTPGADGGAGSDGLSVHVSTIYLRASSAPARPTGGSYNFTTLTLTAPAGGWTEAIPDGPYALYSSTATFSITGTTGTDDTPPASPDTRWSTASQQDQGGLTFGDVSGFSKSDTGFGSGNPWSVSIKVDNDGDIYSKVEGGSYSSNDTWIGNGANTDYDVIASVNQGDDTGSGTLNTWQVCSTDRVYSWTQASTGSLKSATLTLRWRNSSSLVEVGSVQIGIYVGDIS